MVCIYIYIYMAYISTYGMNNCTESDVYDYNTLNDNYKHNN